MERILKRNSIYATNDHFNNHEMPSDNQMMHQYSNSDSIYQNHVSNGSNKHGLCNIQKDYIENNLKLSNTVLPMNSIQYSPKKSELQKLFSHASEVKGDLESVIQALVGIIGNGSNDSSQQNDPILPESSLESSNPSLNDYKNEISPSKYISDYNYKWSKDNAPSVNVENVLKNVRANKIKHEKFHFFNNNNSQPLGSSKDRYSEKIDFKINVQHEKDFKDTFRSMLSDPGQSSQTKLIGNDVENPRKHKSQFSTQYAYDEHWNSTEILVKKIKSVKTTNETVNNGSQLQLKNCHPENDLMPTECNGGWSNMNQTGNINQYSENRRDFNWTNKDMTKNGIIYRNPTNYKWSPGKDLINDCATNFFTEESSWSKVSSVNSQIPHSQIKSSIANERKIDKQGSSVSVSDSGSSIEHIRDPPLKRIPRLPSLCTQLKTKQGKYELILLTQPEQQHRARYMTEGSRGAVKDRSGNGFPTIQLLGWKQSATLQIFVGTEEGRVKPHNFYQACKVSGKQILSCKERVFDTAGLIEVQLEAQENQIIVLDCIGILKLRNVDVERRAGIQRIKQKSTMARLVFRVNLPLGDGNYECLQVASDPILCTQPVGTPEISKMSLHEGSYKGNMELFIIGKNIVKNSRVLFQDYSEHRGIVWQAEAKIDTEYLQQTHLICFVPPYGDEKLKTPTTVQVVLNCSGRLSEPRYFTYLPEPNESPMNLNKPYKFGNWKVEKSDFSDVAPFPIEECSLNLDISHHSRESDINKSRNEMLYCLEYRKPNDNSFDSNSLFLSMNNEVNYSSYTLNKNQNEMSINPHMEWLPCTKSKEIPISLTSQPNEKLSNSLDSNIEHDCILQDSNLEQTPQTESLIKFTKVNVNLTNL